MQIKLFKKLKAVIVLSAVAAICLGFFVASAISRTFAQGGKAVPLGYAVDFTSYEYDGSGGVKDFAPLAEAAEINGLILGVDLSEPKSLSVWTGNPQAVREGYILYKISADKKEEKLFKTLKIVYTGRIDDWAGNSDCGLRIYAGAEAENLSLVKSISTGNDGSSVREFDLSGTEGIVGAKECYVKIAIKAAQTWVNIEKLSFSGEAYYGGYKEENIEIANGDEVEVLSLSDGKNGVISASVKELKVNSDCEYEVFYEVVKNDAVIYSGISSSETFEVSKTGEYAVRYKAIAEGKREYTAEYSFYVVNNAGDKGTTEKKTGFAYSDFSSSSKYRLSSVKGFTSRYYGFELSSEATYLTALSLESGINLRYKLCLPYEGLFEIVFANSDKIDFSGKKTEGIYLDFTTGASTELKVYLSDGEDAATQLVYNDIAPQEFHDIGIRLNSERKLVITFDNKEKTLEANFAEYFSSEKVYAGYNSQGGKVYVTHDDEWNYNGFYEEDNYVSVDKIARAGRELSISGETNYLLPVDFSGNFNLNFDFDGLTKDKEVEIAVTNRVGRVDFDGKTAAGLYFVIKKSGDLPLLRAYFSGRTASGEISVTSLGEMLFGFTEGKHSLGFARRAAAPFTGIEIFADGEQFASYATCYTVNTDDFIENGNVYVSFRIRNGSIRLSPIVKADAYAPVMYDENYDFYKISKRTETGYKSGDFYELKNIVMIDYIDGEVPYKLTVYDPNGDEVTVIEKDGKKGFYLNFTGEYGLKYVASDNMGNVSENYIYAEVDFSSEAPRMVFESEVLPYGRNGTYFTVPRPSVYLGDELREDLEVYCKITKPDGNTITYVVPAGNLNFVPSDLGIYTFLYFTEVNGHTTYAKYKSNIKKNVDHNDSYRNVFDEKYWRGSDFGVTATEKGIKISETAYCELPFETEKNGLAITLDVSSLGNKRLGADNYLDCWVSLGIGKNPQSGGFGSPKKGAIYFMIYREDSEYLVNALVCNDFGTVFSLFGPYSAGASGTVVISFEKIKNSSTKTDNVNLYINYRKIEYDTVSQYVTYSGISDNENFSYLNIYSYGQCPEEYRSAFIKDVSLSDQSAPYYKASFELPSSVRIGDFVEMPKIVINDDLDADFKGEYALYSPSGKRVNYSNSFTAEEEGIYLFVIKAYDKSGNRLNEVIKIRSESKKNVGSGATVIIICCVAAVVVGAAVATVLIVKKKKTCTPVAGNKKNTDKERTDDDKK